MTTDGRPGTGGTLKILTPSVRHRSRDLPPEKVDDNRDAEPLPRRGVGHKHEGQCFHIRWRCGMLLRASGLHGGAGYHTNFGMAAYDGTYESVILVVDLPESFIEL